MESSSEDASIQLARLMSLLSGRKPVSTRGPRYYDHVREVFGERAQIFSAKHDGVTIAAALVVVFGQAVHFVHGAFDYEYRALYPNELLHGAIVEWSRAQGLARYELGGACTSWPPDEADPGYGVYRFKKRMGASTSLRGPYLDLFPSRTVYAASAIAESVGLPLVAERGTYKVRIAWDRLRNR